MSAATTASDMRAAADAMNEATKAALPFDEVELDLAIQSLRGLAPTADDSVDWEALRELYAKCAHRSHKQWGQTGDAASLLAKIIEGPDSACFEQIFKRVLKDGNWMTAVAQRPVDAKPWVVLVTGLNGIRKTTSVHSPWFQELLKEALGDQFDGEVAELPNGGNAFFRQLDYMIATLACERFRKLYTIDDDVALYSEYKAGIFARYRTLAEVLGVLLVRAAQAKGLNVMVETSGRDVGMYKYVDTFFPDGAYRKLVLNFEIDDISFAERSVDVRMAREMVTGKAALEDGTSPAIVSVNAGGPYGSAVLAGVQADSRKVWRYIGEGVDGVASTWFKASIVIEADADKSWRARAAGTGNTSFEFGEL